MLRSLLISSEMLLALTFLHPVQSPQAQRLAWKNRRSYGELKGDDKAVEIVALHLA